MKAIAITRLGSTLVRKALIVSLAFGVAATSAWGARISHVNADDDDSARVVYRYLSGTGITELGSVCDLGVDCPTAAMAAGGNTVEIVGEGKLSIER